LKVDLLDESGEIGAIMFNEAVDQFKDILQVDKVYLISKGTLKFANKKFTSIKNDYEITLQPDSIVEPATDDNVNIPSMHFSFVRIDQIEDLQKDDVIDVIGVLKNVSEMSSIRTRTSNEEIAKREITLVDSSNRSVDLTLWRDVAENFNVTGNPVLAIKNVKVSDFNARSLTTTSSTRLTFNPNIKQAKELSVWWKTLDAANIRSITEKGMMSAGGSQKGPLEEKTFSQIKDEGLGRAAPAFFMVRGTITIVKHDENTPLYYSACPGTNCNKKVIPSNSQYFCEKCNKSYPSCDMRYILAFAASDHTGHYWLNAFNDQGKSLLSKSAAEISKLRQEGSPEFETIFNEATFRTYNFKLRAREENYNDETRIKCNVLDLYPLNYVDESQKLLTLIQQYQ